MTLPALAMSRSAIWLILRKVERSDGRDRRLGVAQPGQLGDVPGEVAHPLQVGTHPQAGHDGAQVARDRPLAGQQLERPFVEVVPQVVDRRVGGDDALGQAEVGVEQGGGRSADGRADQSGHLDQLFADGVELFVICLAHGCPFVSCWPAQPRHDPVNGQRPLGEQSSMTRCAVAPEGNWLAPDRHKIEAVDADVVGVLAGLVGLLTGVSADLAFRVSEKQQRTVPGRARAAARLPSGVAEVLAVLRSWRSSSTPRTGGPGQPGRLRVRPGRDDRLVAPDLLELDRKGAATA